LKNKSKKIIYEEPPMVFNIALNKFVPDMPMPKKHEQKLNIAEADSKNIFLAMVLIIGILIILGIAMFMLSKQRLI
jgi:hypothetical protein